VQGERRRKSVRGCVISGDVAVLNLKIVKKGEQVGCTVVTGAPKETESNRISHMSEGACGAQPEDKKGEPVGHTL
jgi:hypothetical protein